jgi:hypothetical protein
VSVIYGFDAPGEHFIVQLPNKILGLLGSLVEEQFQNLGIYKQL